MDKQIATYRPLALPTMVDNLVSTALTDDVASKKMLSSDVMPWVRDPARENSTVTKLKILSKEFVVTFESGSSNTPLGTSACDLSKGFLSSI